MASSMPLLVDLVIWADVHLEMAQMVEAIVLAGAAVEVDASVVDRMVNRLVRGGGGGNLFAVSTAATLLVNSLVVGIWSYHCGQDQLRVLE